MSASTQAKPRGGKVSVRKCVDEMLFTPGSYCVTGYSGSAKTLKRLVEIAGMDEDSFSAWMTKVYAESSRDGKGTIKAMREALGLSSARGGRSN